MAQPTIKYDLDTMENLNSILSSITQASSPTEQFDPVVYSAYNTANTLEQIDFADLNSIYLDQAFIDLFSENPSNEEFTVSSPMFDENDVVLYNEYEEPRSVEPDDIADSIPSTDEQLAMIKSDSSVLPVIRRASEKLSTQVASDQSISLSNSVAVTVHTRNPLQLTHQLEETYRARYKSDYFPQKGEPRRPRYVADNKGNHCVTLQLPADYNRDLSNEYIRVALITTSMSNSGQYYSPYKFQTHHRDAKIPDENPIYLPVQSHRGIGSTLKLHLVLIKSKLDQLNHAQPLKPFDDQIGSISNLFSDEKLSPKELINKYQLDKSHIAFTLCTKLSKDQYRIHPETTTVSSVITELPPKQTATTAAAAAAKAKNTPKTSTANPGKRISCPNCSHCFEMPDEKLEEKGTKRKSTTRTSTTIAKSTSNARTSKKTKTTE